MPQGCLAVAPRDFLRRRVVRQKITSFFCARGSSVKKQRVFSAPEGRSSKNNEFFLRPRVVRQKITSFFCAGGSSVKKQWIFSAPQGRASKNNEFFLRRKLVRQKTTTFSGRHGCVDAAMPAGEAKNNRGEDVVLHLRPDERLRPFGTRGFTKTCCSLHCIRNRHRPTSIQCLDVSRAYRRTVRLTIDSCRAVTC